MTIIEFLNAQLDEDARLARAAVLIMTGVDGGLFESPYDELTDHAVRWDPQRALDEVDAKRAIMELHQPVESPGDHSLHCGTCMALADIGDSITMEGDHISVSLNLQRYPCPTLLALLRPYAGNPGWDFAWGPAD
jgi:hypothetical protein